MSLINQALKQEQRRRASPDLAAAAGLPMARLARSRAGGDKALTVIIGFTVVGLILAALAGAFIFFGSRYLDSMQISGSGAKAEPPDVSPAAQVEPPPAPMDEPPADSETEATSQSALADLSPAELEQLRQLLHQPQGSARALAPARAAPPPVYEDPEIREAHQGIVDKLAIQGFRKAGAASRAMMNGKLFKMGDVVDHASGLTLIDYTDSTLVFEDMHGYRYERVL